MISSEAVSNLNDMKMDVIKLIKDYSIQSISKLLIEKFSEQLKQDILKENIHKHIIEYCNGNVRLDPKFISKANGIIIKKEDLTNLCNAPSNTVDSSKDEKNLDPQLQLSQSSILRRIPEFFGIKAFERKSGGTKRRKGKNKKRSSLKNKSKKIVGGFEPETFQPLINPIVDALNNNTRMYQWALQKPEQMMEQVRVNIDDAKTKLIDSEPFKKNLRSLIICSLEKNLKGYLNPLTEKLNEHVFQHNDFSNEIQKKMEKIKIEGIEQTPKDLAKLLKGTKGIADKDIERICDKNVV
uniref:Uncharacterized protein n=1 Tax=viral metagenome TaxID=1070528 RepID=A0A6C0CN53_9ZZZZ